MTRIYETRAEYEKGEAKWRALWHDYESHDETSPFRAVSTCNRLAESWQTPFCFFANRGCPKPDIFSLFSHYAVNAHAKDVLSKELGDSVEFLPLETFSGVVIPKDLGPILGRIGTVLGTIKNWYIKAKVDNADNYWLLHILKSVAPDPHRPQKKLGLDFHYDRSESIDDLSAFRVRDSDAADAAAGDQIWVTDTFCEAYNEHRLTGLKFIQVHDTSPAS